MNENDILRFLGWTVVFVFIALVLYVLWLLFFSQDNDAPVDITNDSPTPSVEPFPSFGVDAPLVQGGGTLPDSPIVTDAPQSAIDGENDVSVQSNVSVQTSQRINRERLVKVFDGPTAGFFVPQGDAPIVVIQKGDGERYLIDKSSYALQKVDSPGVLKTVMAFPLSDGSVVIQQQNPVQPRHTNTFLYRKNGSSWQSTSIGSDVAVFPEKRGNGFIYTKETNEGLDIRSVGLANRESYSLSHPFRSWSIIWSGSVPLLLTKPHNSIKGSLYSFSDIALSSIVKNEPALSVEANDEDERFLISQVNRNSVRSYILDENKQEKSLQRETLAEKCVFTDSRIFCGLPQRIPTGYSLPEDWYQGRFFFTDDVVELFPESGRVRSVDTASVPLDVYRGVFVDPLFVFINKRDLSLWALNTNI